MPRASAHSRALIASLCLGLALAACSPTGQQVTLPASPEILWDTWGVPHIFAPDDAGLFYGFGWAQAKSHGDLILRLIGESRGRAAEYWGEERLDLDRWVWTMGIPGRAEAWYAAQDEELRAYLDAFVAGFNDYASAHAEAIDSGVAVVLPLTGPDVLAHIQRIIHFTFIVNPGQVAGVRARFAEQPGSNTWAIAPKRSASGNAILVANPHLPWTDLFTWYEAQLTGPDVDVYGASLVGTPFLGIAFNDFLGWSHTVNTHDGDDLFELTLTEGGYVFDGETRAFDSDTVALLVKQEDGSHREEPLTVLRTIHGPIVAQQGDKALALRVVGLDAPHLLRQYWDMSRATDLEAFETAIREMQMPMFTFMYADRAGNILHHFGGETPIRPRGDWETWSRPVPGDSSEWLWTDVHPYDELPTVLNPDSGWLQNANDPPWTTTFPEAIDADDFPPYMAPRFMHFRAQRSAEIMYDDDSVTFEEAVAYKQSSRMALADRLLDDLEAAIEDHGDATARQAMEVLSAWDRTADADSRGGVLFESFVNEMQRRGTGFFGISGPGFAIPWSEDAPRITPDGLADPAGAAAALSAAATRVVETHGAMDVPWGRVNRLRVGEHDHPANGGSGSLGIFRVVGFQPQDDGTATAAGGDSYVAVVEFSDPVRAEVLLSYGNATQPGSPHVGDQLELFSRKELRPAWRERAEIEANLEELEVLEPGG